MNGSGCKKCPASQICTAQYRGSRCAANRATYGVEDDPFTNSDHIRRMSDEELAEFLDFCENRGYEDSSVAVDVHGCMIPMLDWLQLPWKKEV